MLPAAINVAIVCVGNVVATPLVVGRWGNWGRWVMALPKTLLAAVVEDSMKPLRLPDDGRLLNALYKFSPSMLMLLVVVFMLLVVFMLVLMVVLMLLLLLMLLLPLLLLLLPIVGLMR